MPNYQELISQISQSNHNTVEPLKKLIYLAVYDQPNFQPYAATISLALNKYLSSNHEDEPRLLCLQLFSQMATNYPQCIPVDSYDFGLLVCMLADENAEIRKAAHYLLLIFVKKYERIDEVLSGYSQQVRQSADQWKIIQKIAHSFQSLLIIEPKCVTYAQKYFHFNTLMTQLIGFRAHSNYLVQKASQQALTSFVKNQHVSQVIEKFDPKIMKQLCSFAEKLSVVLLPQQTLKETNRSQIQPNTQLKSQHTNESALSRLEDKNSWNQTRQPSSTSSSFARPPSSQIEQVNLSPMMSPQLMELLHRLQGEGDWKLRCDTIEEICKLISSRQGLKIPEDLIEKVLDLTYDYNFKTCVSAMTTLHSLVTLYWQQVSHKERQIEDVTLDKICDLKTAVRQIGMKILKNLAVHKNKQLTKKILSKLSSCSVAGKQEILGFIQQWYGVAGDHRPELPSIIVEVSSQLVNDNTKIKIKAIDCLVKISLGNDLQECKTILSKRLNKVYYDMFQQRLREKQSQPRPERWEEMGRNVDKAMTLQMERNHQQPQFLTKVEFKPKKGVAYDSHNDDKDSVSVGFNLHAHKSQLTTDTSPSTHSIKTRHRQDDEEPTKQIPMKPNLVRKKPTPNTHQDERGDILVVHSKQYQEKESNPRVAPQHDTTPKHYGDRHERDSLPRTAKSNFIKTTAPKEEEKTTPTKKPMAPKTGHQIDYKATHYAAKQDLQPASNPLGLLKNITTHLPKDDDWEMQFNCLNDLRRIIMHHQEFYPHVIENLPIIMPSVLKHIENLRSSVAKNAMMTLSEMCETLKKNMDPFLEGIFAKLYKKVQDANTFIVDEAKKCMASLCTYCSIAKLAPILITNSQAKATPVRLKTALCLDYLLERKGYELDVLRQYGKLTALMGHLIMDGAAQVRTTIKESFVAIATANPKSEVEAVFKKNCSKEGWQRMKGILEKQLR